MRAGRKFRDTCRKIVNACLRQELRASGRPAVVAERMPLLYFCGSTGPFRRLATPPTTQVSDVLTSVAAGRRLAQRAIAWQAVAIAVTALAFLAKDPVWSLAAVLGGAGIAIGGWLSSVIALGGGVSPSGSALARLLAGVALKWVVVVAVLWLGVGMAGLPPVPTLAGVAVALVAQLIAMASGHALNR